MTNRVALVGVGYVTARAVSPDVSYKEMIFEAAMRAYQDAGIHWKDIQSFVTCAEDFNEGTSIFDEYTPDQLGAVLKPMHTVGGDGLHGIADAAMQIMTGMFDLVVVEAHSKASNVLTPHHILNYAVDPVLNRPLGMNPHYIAGVEMRRFLYETRSSEEMCANVVVKNRTNAMRNPSGVYGASLTVMDVMKSAPMFSPLKELEISGTSDGAAIVVLASEERARKLKNKPVWVRGISWINDTPTLESRDWGRASYVELASKKACAMAGIKNAGEVDFLEVDDTYSYKELQHLQALGVKNNTKPVNPSGGSLGMGHMLEATGLVRTVEAVLQLRGEAGERQVPGAKVGLVQSWRGVPTTSAVVAIFGV